MDFTVINDDNYSQLIDYMHTLADDKYRVFQSKLVPGVDNIMGIRVPVLRKLAKEISKGDYNGFLLVCSRQYYEEDMLRGFIISNIKTDYSEFLKNVDGFIPFINNWAVCDTFCSGLKQINKYKDSFFEHIEIYLNNENPWSKRVGLVLMLEYYLEDKYIDSVLKKCQDTKSDEYYVMMGRAWLIATAYARYPEKTKHFLLNSDLDDTTFNMSIQKCVESNRIVKEEKDYLRTIKRR